MAPFLSFSLNLPLKIICNQLFYLMLIQVKVTITSTLHVSPPSCTYNERLFMVSELLFFSSHREKIKDRSSHAVKDIFSHLLDKQSFARARWLPYWIARKGETHSPRFFFYTGFEVHSVLKRKSRVRILACLWINTWLKEWQVRWAVNTEVKIPLLEKSRTQVFVQKKEKGNGYNMKQV